MKEQAYGSWQSPISTSMITDASLKLGDIVLDGDTLYWNEIRSSEQARSVVVARKSGKTVDVLPAPYNARTRVHEYGGGAFCVHEGTTYFSHSQDQHFYSLSPEGIVTDLSKEEGKRYANPIFDSKRGVLYVVQEEHVSQHHIINRLVKIDPKSQQIEILHEGEDFYGMPTLHPDGTHLAFISWNHPNMPWDGSTLWLGELSQEGTLQCLDEIAGGKEESIFQPEWSPEGVLHFISDRTGFWNLYRISHKEPEACYPLAAEFGHPMWVFGLSCYTCLANGKIACIYTVKGKDSLGILDPQTQTLDTLDLPFTSYSNLKGDGKNLYFMGASPSEMKTLVRYDFNSIERIRCSKEVDIDPGYLSLPQTLEFPTNEGKTAFAFFYPPKNKDYKGIDTPPLIVKSHGGPSTQSTSALNLEIQYWTSRGIAYLDVNYGGSTGYGREYRERLKGKWGTVDVDDCTNGALYLAKQGLVNGNKMAIKGGSAGGYTTLAALTFKDVFQAGVSYYGVSDLEALAQDTHKFESHYLETLIGPYPKEKKRYIAASPIHFTEKLSSPLLLLQGSEDPVVPPSQAEKMFHALLQKKIPVAYLLFEGEQHGFRLSENVQRALESELYFYSKIFGFNLSESIEPLLIHNFSTD